MCCFEPKLVKVHMCIRTFQVSVSAVAEAHYLCLLQACLSGMASSSLSCVKTCCSFASSFFLPAAAPMCCISTLSSTISLPVEICSWPSRSSIRLKRAQSWPILVDLSISVSNREVWSGGGAVGALPVSHMSCSAGVPEVPISAQTVRKHLREAHLHARHPHWGSPPDCSPSS